MTQRWSRRARRAPLIVGLGLAAAAAVVAGCGGAEPPESAQAATDGAKAAAAATPAPKAPARLKTLPLNPPKPTIDVPASAAVAPGLVFIAPKAVFGAKVDPDDQHGPEIIDNQGRVRWFQAMPAHQDATDFRVQTYKGRPVITYWQGRQVNGQGDGTCVVMDTSYQVIAKVGDDTDLHECEITPQGTMLATSYTNVTADLTSVGGKKKDELTDSRAEVYDIATGKKLLSWSAMQHVSLGSSYQPIKQRYNGHWDFFHINSIDQAPNGDLIISSRHTWTVYAVDPKTGDVVWRLGGKHSTFKLPPAVKFAWQHDARAVGDDEIRIFDNDAGTNKVRQHSRVETIKLDLAAKTASLVGAIEHPKGLSAGTQGNARVLANGDMFVGWGSQGYFSEFDPHGKLIFDGRVPHGMDSYRAYRGSWDATPATKPALAAVALAGGRTKVYASWNGSTAVQSWQLLAGASATALAPVGAPLPWNGLETAAAVASVGPYFAIQALGADGKPLAGSPTIKRKAG